MLGEDVDEAEGEARHHAKLPDRRPSSGDGHTLHAARWPGPDDPWRESFLGDPDLRAEIYRAIHPGGDFTFAPLLRGLLVAEVRHRARELERDDEDDEDDDHFEQLYWCAYLLAELGDPADVPRLWRAKHTTFDTSIGMDVQCLVVGVGVDATLAFLETSEDPDAPKIAARLRACRDAGDFGDLEGWRVRWRAYFGD